MVHAQVVPEGGHTAVLGLVHGDDGRLKGVLILKVKSLMRKRREKQRDTEGVKEIQRRRSKEINRYIDRDIELKTRKEEKCQHKL